MLTARTPSPSSPERPSGALESETELDARFERRLDNWLSTYRIAITAAAFVLVVVLMPALPWLWALVAAYLVAGAAVLPALRLVGSSESGKLAVRAAILLVDVLTVSIVTYRWGVRASPAAFMYVPIVVGWALLPQRGLGRLALALVLSTLGALVWLEPTVNPLVPAWASGAGRLLFFGLIASALVAVHELLSYAVAQLHEHRRYVSALLAERRTREREAEWAAQLEEAQRLESLGRLAGGIAHDFNNLLTALIGSAELAEMLVRKDVGAAQREIENIKAAAERGSSLTSQLLEFASRRPAEPRDLELRRTVEDTAQLLQRLLPLNVRVQLALSSEPCGVRLDPSSLERLLMSLCVNAADAMPDGGMLTLAVRPLQGADGDRVLLEVRDTGTGIAPEDLPFIFEPFFTRKPRGKGTGLGLASVYGIVRQSHGEIEAESTLGAGTTFRISWPRVPLVTEAIESPRHAAHAGNGTILLVDDDDAVRAILAEHLRSAGYDVISVPSGTEALAVLDGGTHADLLLSDVSMPGMSGIELVQVVRERGSRMPVLLISGYAHELNHEGVRADLDAAFLAKPFTRERLIAEVSDILEAQSAAADERRFWGSPHRAGRRRLE